MVEVEESRIPGTRELSQQLRAHAVLPMDLMLILSTYMVAYNCWKFMFWEI